MKLVLVGSSESLWVKLIHIGPCIRVIVQDIEWQYHLYSGWEVHTVDCARLLTLSVHSIHWWVQPLSLIDHTVQVLDLVNQVVHRHARVGLWVNRKNLHMRTQTTTSNKLKNKDLGPGLQECFFDKTPYLWDNLPKKSRANNCVLPLRIFIMSLIKVKHLIPNIGLPSRHDSLVKFSVLIFLIHLNSKKVDMQQ